MTENQFSFSDPELYKKVCGTFDNRLKILEEKLGVEIIPRGNSFILNGNAEKISFALDFFSKLEKNYKNRPDREDFDLFDLNYMISSRKTGESSTGWQPGEKVLTTWRGKSIYPKTENQARYVRSLLKNFVTFGVGPAGTGKTFLSIAVACNMLQNRDVDRIVLTRPAVEAGESLGYLPGDIAQKVDPYLRPVYDALYECLGYEKVQEHIAMNRIEVAPIAFMRGRTLSNSFVILDEAQNCTVAQLKMILTRFGQNSRMCLSGDITQIDLEHGKSGFEKVVNIFRDTKGIGTTGFGPEDITRHPIVEVMIHKFQDIK